MTLSSYLKNKGYTEFEIDETLLRLDAGMELPAIILNDIRGFFFVYYDQKNT